MKTMIAILSLVLTSSTVFARQVTINLKDKISAEEIDGFERDGIALIRFTRPTYGGLRLNFVAHSVSVEATFCRELGYEFSSRQLDTDTSERSVFDLDENKIRTAFYVSSEIVCKK